MKTIKRIVTVTAILTFPAAAFGQAAVSTSDSLTRGQVGQDLIQVEQAGYEPSAGDRASYPRDLQAAEARVSAQQVGIAGSGYGGVSAGSSESAAKRAQPMNAPAGIKPVHFGH
ncbi:DUF4148 domain-containing protein [Paraburkholderia sp. BR10882]|uniref:DUF4148 domain-containing protein n=1 Tax=unclassified Paraburkholderia TaxID=2615204 RepID=UPI0034CE75BD